jgi:hypothetical protein
MELLVCMRADAPMAVAGTAFDRKCCRCGSGVMIAPSGVKRLERTPGMEIICYPCASQRADFKTAEHKLSDTVEVIARELATAAPNRRREQN